MTCQTCFVTGTDTGVGKTWATLALMQAARRGGRVASGMKPVASGATLQSGHYMNEDALEIQSLCSQSTEYEDVNPYALPQPISPNFAARMAGISLSLDHLLASARRLQSGADFLAIEGVGGWRVPWSDTLQARDLVLALDIPVILVVGLRLGCINHAMLTAEALAADNVRLAGWLASPVEAEYPGREDTLRHLSGTLPMPCLGVLPRLARLEPESLAGAISLQVLYRHLSGLGQ